jgi:signal transduction histidine kinase
LGLPIVAAIVERHRGRVTVDGSTFTIELPALPRAPSGQPPRVGAVPRA